jgi:hypothetical protein
MGNVPNPDWFLKFPTLTGLGSTQVEQRGPGESYSDLILRLARG